MKQTDGARRHGKHGQQADSGRKAREGSGNRREVDGKRGQVAMTSQHTGQEGLEGREGLLLEGETRTWNREDLCCVELEAMLRGAWGDATWSVRRCCVEREAMLRAG